jgi:hypothetical protein
MAAVRIEDINYRTIRDRIQEDLPMQDAERQIDPENRQIVPPAARVGGTNQSIHWHAKGQARIIEINGIPVTIKLVDRQGRRGRIASVAPPEAVFRASPNGRGEKPD